jgi:hypothetical protein
MLCDSLSFTLSNDRLFPIRHAGPIEAAADVDDGHV